MAASTCSVRDVLLQSIDTAFDKKSWHGSTLDGILRRVDAATAARRFRDRHTVWEQTLHAAYWKNRILSKLAGQRKFPRKGSDWPAMPVSLDEKSWNEDVELLRATHRELRNTIASRATSDFDAKTIWLIHGAAAHDLYHAGQIKLMLRFVRAENVD